MEFSKVSSDAMPALTGRRCVGTVIEVVAFLRGKQGGTAESVFSVLVPLGEQGLFYFRKENCYDKEITGKAMVQLTTANCPTHINIY